MNADRDRTLEQALKHELRARSASMSQPGEGCLDAETLAAWQDEGLDAAQMSSVELHLSTCPHCQQMLGALARGTTSTRGAETNIDLAGTPTATSWWRWWFAPIAAGAAAAVLWMVVPEEQQIAMTPPQSPPAISVDKAQPPAASEQKSADAPAEPQDVRARAADSAVRENRSNVDSQRFDPQPKDQAPATAAKEEAPALLAQPAAPAPPSPARAEAAGARIAELEKSAQTTLRPTEVPTGDGNVRWRFDGSRLERTSDAGATWMLMRNSANETIFAGAAPTSSVAWFAGRNGIVLLTIDAGATFTNVSLPEPLDIAGISATDQREAIVSTVGGRRFRTEDAGRTWQPY